MELDSALDDGACSLDTHPIRDNTGPVYTVANDKKK